ncbi:right-handed parallel beta-helix repeat-containing protein [Lysinibacillus sp. FSL K6-4013]|uniref:right-handed parallel beta-helix repeat-containing protein n=1 Tax=Lysinibacillus sp. FSL K6-4013 TaxID=2921504 RepID=UPI003159CA5A
MELKKHIVTNMKKGSLLALFFCIVGFSTPAYAQSVQQQIDSLSSGEILELEPGLYSENLLIKEPIKINGNKGVKFTGKIEIKADDVEISGIQFLGEQGIVAKKVKNIKITQNSFQTKRFPIYFDGVENSEIAEVDVIGKSGHYSEKSHGISLYNSKGIHIKNSTITQTQDGIYLENSRQVTIEKNTITYGRYGTHIMYGSDMKLLHNNYSDHITGVMSMMANNVDIEENTIKHQNALNSSGITLYQTSKVNVVHNIIRENSIAVQLQQADTVDMSSNIFASNLLVFKNIQPKDVLVTNNQLYGNVLVASSGSQGITLRANVYDDYEGEDFDEDGYGDSVYIATSTFGKWVLKNEYYQYFIGSTATGLLEKMDNKISEPNALMDAQPIVREGQPWQLSFSGKHLSIGVALLIVLVFSWRKLK